jgi:hypothetical protein
MYQKSTESHTRDIRRLINERSYTVFPAAKRIHPQNTCAETLR